MVWMHVRMAVAIVFPGIVTCASVTPKMVINSVLRKSILLAVVVVESRATRVRFGLWSVVVAIAILATTTASLRRMERIRYERSMIWYWLRTVFGCM